MGAENLETALFAITAAVAALPFLWQRGRRPAIAMAATVGLVAVAVVAQPWEMGHAERVRRDAARAAHVPRPSTEGGYVSSDRCRACHPAEYASWRSSFHRTMTQRPGPDTVLAPFDGRELVDGPRRYRVERRGDDYWVRSGDDPWQRVVLLTGSHHQQRYWTRTDDGRSVALFPMAYLIREGRWVPGDALFVQPPGATVVGAEGLWNRNCVGCHSVAPEPRLDPQGPDADTRVAELGIACEACHGPGAEHVRVNGDPLRRYARHVDDEDDPTIVNPAKLPPRESSQICGQCHGVYVFKRAREWRQSGARFRPGGDLGTDRFLMRVARSPAGFRRLGLPVPPPGYLGERFWSDGMVRVSGREYTGMTESECHRRGDLGCLSCHQMHGANRDDQLAPGKEGDGACAPCHADHIRAGSEHTHHPESSAGARCYACHMPHTTFGLLKGIRSHQIDSPSVAASIETGRPNACNLCHLDRTLAWTSEHLRAWYGAPSVSIGSDERTVPASVVWALRGDAGQRALAAWAYGRVEAQEASGTEWMVPVLAELLVDPYAAVRFNAGRSLSSLPGLGALAYDYVAPEAERRSARDHALAAWSSARHATGSDHPTLFLAGDSADGRHVLTDLLRRRDDRPVMLKE